MNKLFFLILAFAFTLNIFGQTPEFKNYFFPDVEIVNMSDEFEYTSEWNNNGNPILIVSWMKDYEEGVKLLDNINEVYPEWKEKTGVKCYALNVNIKTDTDISEIDEFAKEHNWTFEIVWDQFRSFMDALEITSVPMVMVLDRKMNVFRSYLGADIPIDIIYGLIYNTDKKKQYFDESWQFTTPDKHAYYRIIETDYSSSVAPYKIKDYFKSGQQQMVTQASQLIPLQIYEGTLTRYRESGVISEIETYKNGIYHGITKKYFENGDLWFENYFKDGLLWNIGQVYSSSGKKLDSGNFRNGKGQVKAYYGDGAISRIYEMFEGKYNGPYKKYDVDGHLIQNLNYKDGTLHGSCIYYYTNGNREAEGDYYNGNKNGVWSYFYEDGTKRAIQEFNKGELYSTEYFNKKGKSIYEETDELFTNANINSIIDADHKYKGEKYGDLEAVINYIYLNIVKGHQAFVDENGDYGTAIESMNYEMLLYPNFRKFYITYLRLIQFEYLASLSQYRDEVELIQKTVRKLCSTGHDMVAFEKYFEEETADQLEGIEEKRDISISLLTVMLAEMLENGSPEFIKEIIEGDNTYKEMITLLYLNVEEVIQ